jgi:UDP-N-acetylmuramate dehydrogenase
VNADRPSWSGLERAGVVKRDVPLASLTTYRFGGPARFYAELTTRDALDRVLETLAVDPVAVLVVGRGSNLVVSDEGFDGLALKLGGDFLDISFGGDEVTAGGAVPLPRLARAAAKEGRAGLEFLVGVPGSVGGAVAMNAGCFGSETADWLIAAEVVDLTTGATRMPDRAGLDLRYRHSNVEAHELVVSATFRTASGERASAEEKMRDITRWRKETQPGGTYNAGSVFKNPEGDAAGRLIDTAGLKGLTVGGASVSERHANFFVATEEARAQDVYDLVHVVRARVAAHAGVMLEPEIRFAGTFDSWRDPSLDIGAPPS